MARRPSPRAAARSAPGPSVRTARLSAGAMRTRRLPASVSRVPGRTRPRASISSIHSWSAEMKRSAGAPFSICRASAEEAANERVGRAWPFAAQASAAALSDSWRLAAASTTGAAGSGPERPHPASRATREARRAMNLNCTDGHRALDPRRPTQGKFRGAPARSCYIRRNIAYLSTGGVDRDAQAQGAALLRRRDRARPGQGRAARPYRTRRLDLGGGEGDGDELQAGLAAGRRDEPLLSRAPGRDPSRRRRRPGRAAHRGGKRGRFRSMPRSCAGSRPGPTAASWRCCRTWSGRGRQGRRRDRARLARA